MQSSNLLMNFSITDHTYRHTHTHMETQQRIEFRINYITLAKGKGEIKQQEETGGWWRLKNKLEGVETERERRCGRETDANCMKERQRRRLSHAISNWWRRFLHLLVFCLFTCVVCWALRADIKNRSQYKNTLAVRKSDSQTVASHPLYIPRLAVIGCRSPDLSANSTSEEEQESVQLKNIYLTIIITYFPCTRRWLPVCKCRLSDSEQFWWDYRWSNSWLPKMTNHINCCDQFSAPREEPGLSSQLMHPPGPTSLAHSSVVYVVKCWHCMF